MATRFVALLVLLLGLYVSHCAAKDIYGITIDAGSSGSRIYIYKWPSRNTTSLPIVQVVTNKKVSPGISSFSTNVTGVVDHLQPLIDYAKLNIPKTSYNDTYIFLKATAGMRLLTSSDQEAILTVARNTLKASPFIFQNSYAKVITGAEEGLFAYITANFVKNTLVTGNGIGVMDLGGASTQIALDSSAGSAADTTTLKVENRTRTVYTVSFLGIGKDQAILTVKDNLVAHSNGVSASNPCANVGYNETVKGVSLVGSGDFDSCLTLVNNVTSTVITASGTTLPKTDIANTQFVAFSAFYYSAAFLNLVAPTVADSKATVSQFVTAGQNFCSIGYAAAQIQFPNETPSFLKDDCASAAIVVSLLRQYGFSNTSNNVAFVSTIGSFEIGWQLGAMVYEANLLPIDSPIIAPAAPTNVKATVLSSTSLSLTWTAPETGGANITQYYIKVKLNGGSYTDVSAATGSADTKATVTNLSANTAYVFKVAAENSAGVGEYSTDSNVATTSGAAAAARVSVGAIVLAVVAAVVLAL